MPKSSAVHPPMRRQWGTEKSSVPLSTIHDRPSDRKIALSRLAIVATVVFWFAYVINTILRQFLNNGTQSFRFTTEAISYLIVVTFLCFSAVMYLLARHGALQRFRAHVRVPRAELDRHFFHARDTLTVLVPSYNEEPHVIRKTLLSAALQEYAGLRIVLLLDDPPAPSDPAAATRLEQTRRLAQEINNILANPRIRFQAASERFGRVHPVEAGAPTEEDVRELARHYRWAADWLKAFAAAEQRADHVDDFFIDQVLGGLEKEFEVTALALEVAADRHEAPSALRMSELYRRLVSTFQAEVTTFERKRYASLSHEANKAMNLNSYIGLMGGRYSQETTPDGPVLKPVDAAGLDDLIVPDSDFILTLDADSILLPEYCLRLVHLMHEPGNERVAVAQTPYSSFRGAPTRIERLAGATTDLQHILHQGMTYYDATFWVGANAVIRKRALDDIVEIEMEGGFQHRRYVQDRTVIEDTESSVDLGSHGWRLINYPERLSYSATPPDFGSLIVQRRRWANGGLLIMPKLLQQVRDRRRRGEHVRFSELLLRTNYMASIAWASFGLVFLLAYPYDSRLLSPLVVCAAVPYFWAMASDLKYSGYRYTDIVRIYGFNLILLPVNLAGVLKSIEQAITGRKIPFARTPKVKSRTATPIIYLVAPLAIIAFSILIFWRDLLAQNWGNATFAAVNTLLASFAFLSYIGVGRALVDVWVGATRWLYVERMPASAPVSAQPVTATLDWEAVLYHGQAVSEATISRERSRLTVSSHDRQAA